MADTPLCFVLMPFGSKKDPAGGPDIDFNAIYMGAIQPAIVEAGMEPIRADEERTGGIIHKAMFERLLLCDFAVADLTTANANVFYELGVRHATRPATTLPVFAARHLPPFDVNYLRAMPYELAERNRFGPDEARTFRAALVKRLSELLVMSRDNPAPDSPIFQLLKDYKPPEVAHLATDVFRDRARYSEEVKHRLAAARTRRDLAGLREVEKEMKNIDYVEAGVVVDLMLSYRAVEAYDEMVRLYENLKDPMKRIVLLRQQYGFALNRQKQRQRAIDALTGVLNEHGPSSETYGLIARVHKDWFADAIRENDDILAAGALDAAIDGYRLGFEADLRDAYPGVNYVTLLDVKGDAASQAAKAEVLPVVRYAVMQRVKDKKPAYWDYATLVELAVLADDQDEVHEQLKKAVATRPEPWMLRTTVNNLQLIRDGRNKRGAPQVWLDEVIGSLEKRAGAVVS